MGPYSVYAIAESEPAKWRPSEDLAACGFLALTFYLFLDINFSIYRVFRKKQGLYYWSMLLGSWGCVTDSIAVVLKYYMSNSERIWILYTLFILLGWTIYAPAQLLVLYSRLHFINQNYKLARMVLIMIITTATLMIIPSWTLDWQAFNPYNRRSSSLYSPREAIWDRCTQIGYTTAESTISGIYIYSLNRHLNRKPTVRQRRVMTDLIYIVTLGICLDILTVILVFLNKTGISHPIQTFSYCLKLKLEFGVLNQLMAVAARGIRRENFAERRYHHPSTSMPSDNLMTATSSQTSRWGLDSVQESYENDFGQRLFMPSPAVRRAETGYSALDVEEEATPQDPQRGQQRFSWSKPWKSSDSEADDEEGEIGLRVKDGHESMVIDVPWFRA